MATFLLIRHGSCAHVGRALSGRAPGVHLDDRGRDEARRLARMLAPVPLTAVYASPLERAQETAAAIAEAHGLDVQTLTLAGEIEFGAWTGRGFDDLGPDARWRRFNTLRSVTRPPGGELMLEAQARVVAALAELAESAPDATSAIVSHADVIRAALALFGGIPLDLVHRFEIAPASVTTVHVTDHDIAITGVNQIAPPD